MRRIGVLVMSYGTPESMDKVEEYYTHIRRGKPPTPEQLNNLKDRYQAIGGLFPLRKNTDAQVEALQEYLNRYGDGLRWTCYQGLKHAHPLIEEGMAKMAQDGVNEAVGIVLTPHYSRLSVGSYIERAQAAADDVGLPIRFVKEYHLHPQLISAWAERVKRTLTQFATDRPEEVHILFTAHSLPEKILEMNDPYVDQLQATARAVMAESGLDNPWQLAWQSAGETPLPWLGPDILEVLPHLQEEGVKQVLVCPIGFVSDHLEILFDLDIEAKQLANQLGIELRRPPSLNADPRYISLLAQQVMQAWQGELDDGQK